MMPAHDIVSLPRSENETREKKGGKQGRVGRDRKGLEGTGDSCTRRLLQGRNSSGRRAQKQVEGNKSIVKEKKRRDTPKMHDGTNLFTHTVFPFTTTLVVLLIKNYLFFCLCPPSVASSPSSSSSSSSPSNTLFSFTNFATKNPLTSNPPPPHRSSSPSVARPAPASSTDKCPKHTSPSLRSPQD